MARRSKRYNLHNRSRRFRPEHRSRRHRMIKAAVNGTKEIQAAKSAIDEAVNAVIALQQTLGDSEMTDAHRRSLVLGQDLMKVSAKLMDLRSELAKGASEA